MAPLIVGIPRRRLPSTGWGTSNNAVQGSCYAFVVVFVVVVFSASSHYKHYRNEHPELWAPPSPAQVYEPRVLPHGIAYTLEQARLSQHQPPPSPPDLLAGWRNDGLGYQQNLVKLRHTVYDASPPPPLPPAPPAPSYVEPRGNLTLALVLMRGGDRTALYNFADWEKGYRWPGGLGRLSAVGMQQAFKVGAELHRRYQQEFRLFNATFKADHVIAWAAKYERTIDSMNALLLGLFPPAGGRQSAVHSDCLCRVRPAVQGREAGSLGDRGEGIRCIADCLGYRLPRWWLAGAHQRIHVHTVPPKEDFRLTPMKACRVAAGASRQHTSGKHWKRGEEVYQQQLFELATRLLDPNGTRASWTKTKLCDVSVEKLTDTRLALERGDTRLKRLCVPIGLRALLMVYSNLRAASAHKQPPLEGADREQLLRDWAGARDWALRRMYGEHTSGGLLNEVLETLVRGTIHGGKRADGHIKHTPKLTLYSAQEGTLISFLTALNVTDAPLPEFGDYITVELWQHWRHSHKAYEVRIDYQGRPLTGVAGCPLGRCSHTALLKALQHRALSPQKLGCSNWEKHGRGAYWSWRETILPPPAPKRVHLHDPHNTKGAFAKVDGGDWQMPVAPPPGTVAAAPPSPPAPAARRSIDGSGKG